VETTQSAGELQTKQKGKLLHILGVGFGIAGAIGATIGAGILRTPGSVAAHLGNSTLIIAAWIVGGIYALLSAISVAELAASMPQAGGWYVYARRAFGDYAGFIVGWMDWLCHCAILAWILIIAGEYSAALVPALSGRAKLVAIIVLLFFSLLHLLGLRAGSSSQKILSLAKALAFIALVAACFIFGGKTSSPATSQTVVALPQTATTMFIAIVFSLQATIATYGGWYTPIYFAEEFSDPGRDIPRSMFGGLLFAIGIYLLINLALLYVLPLQQMATSNLPAADAAQAIFGARSGQMITGLSLLSLLGTINVITMYVPRILFGLGRDGLFSSKGALVNRGGTPVMALLLSACLEGLLVVTGSVARTLGIAAFLLVIIYTVGFICVLIMRQLEPALPRPFKAWGYPWTTLIVVIGSLGFLVGALFSDTANSIYALLLIVISYPIYLLTWRSTKRAQ